MMINRNSLVLFFIFLLIFSKYKLFAVEKRNGVKFGYNNQEVYVGCNPIAQNHDIVDENENVRMSYFGKFY